MYAYILASQRQQRVETDDALLNASNPYLENYFTNRRLDIQLLVKKKIIIHINIIHDHVMDISKIV